jgi:hypothetical protein
MRKWSLAKFATQFLGWNVSRFLKSIKGRTVPYIMVNEANSYLIPTYPRFIVNDLGIEDRGHPMSNSYKPDLKDRNIFNSSDFDAVNEAFGSVIPNRGQTLIRGKTIFFRGEMYDVESIEVTIADYFNDYSFNSFERGIPHEGKATPYNIIIEINLRKKTDN